MVIKNIFKNQYNIYIFKLLYKYFMFYSQKIMEKASNFLDCSAIKHLKENTDIKRKGQKFKTKFLDGKRIILSSFNKEKKAESLIQSIVKLPAAREMFLSNSLIPFQMIT